VVGLGPGAADWRTPEAAAALRSASDLVGYRLYLDLLGPPLAGQARHAYDLGEEAARVRAALDLAAEGRAVALVCSGDPGIYAMAALVFELLDREARADWKRVAITVVPGISALQAAAARIGAPLGHDFCAVSLSDLLTPWPVIERRLEAAADGDFVVALYNPVSKRRSRQLAAAAGILRARRPGDTPVVLARNLGRPGEEIAVIALDELTPDKVDMLTIVLVGSTATRRLARGDGGRWVYTPRGYAAKAGKSSEDAA
jgi:cobalt-precorrin 5A hydrolase/precorrin-3B C17-methyltransferase